MTPIGMLYTDVGKFISFGLRFIMYVTPVVFVIPDTGIMKRLMVINPLTWLIDVNRGFLIATEVTFYVPFLVLCLVMIPVLILSLAIYRVSIPIIIERFSA